MTPKDEVLRQISDDVSYIKGVLDERCDAREKRIAKLEKKTAWTYVFAALLVASEIAFKVFK